MSTVLKAAQEIERRGMPTASKSVAMAGSEEQRGSHLWFFVLGALTLVMGGGFLALQMVDGSVLPPPRPALAAVPAALPVALAVPVPAAAPPPAQVAIAEAADAPWGRVDDDSSAEPEAMPRARAAVANVAPPVAKRERTRVAALPSKVTSRVPAPVESLDDEEVVEPIGRGSGKVGVQVRNILYDADTAERTVSLRIGGAQPVTLHQGESSRGVEVQLITRDGVYLRQGSEIYMVSGRR